jgi:ribosomal protein S18 acetylase RimI-like enzyme
MPVRVATAADIDALSELEAVSPLRQRYGVTRERAHAALSEGLARGDALRLIEEDGALQGFCWVLPRGMFGRSPYLRWIGVRPGANRRGLGRELLRAAEESARPVRPELFLLCSDFNSEAQRFYRREGYSQLGSIPDYVLPGVAELLFWKRLP